MSMTTDGGGPQVSVIGAGAVGCYFGAMLARAGARVILIGREVHVEAIVRNGLFLDGVHVKEAIRVPASSDIRAAREAGIILLSVKTIDTETTAKSLAQCISPGAIVVSLQNGVDNVARIRAASGIEAIPAVVYVAAEMSAPGRVRHMGRGDLVIGAPSSRPDGAGRRADLECIHGLFEAAGVHCRISDNIEGELWQKLIMNCAYNAISALSLARYGSIVSNPLTREVLCRVTEETLAVAGAEGVRMPPGDMVQAALKLADSMSEALSSTAQDVARGKRTEIDALNGYVARRGAELGVPVPVNQTLHTLVKLLERAPERSPGLPPAFLDTH